MADRPPAERVQAEGPGLTQVKRPPEGPAHSHAIAQRLPLLLTGPRLMSVPTAQAAAGCLGAAAQLRTSPRPLAPSPTRSLLARSPCVLACSGAGVRTCQPGVRKEPPGPKEGGAAVGWRLSGGAVDSENDTPGSEAWMAR